MSAQVMVVTANMRRRLPQDHGRLAWPVRRARLVRLLRRHNPDVVMAQECDEAMTPYLVEKLGMAAYKPSAGNRVVFYRQSLTAVDHAYLDLGGRCWAVAVLLSIPGVTTGRAWFVTVHLEPYDDDLRDRQTKALRGWIGELQATCLNVVVGGDFSTEGKLALPFRDVRADVAVVGFGDLASRHTWTRKRRRAPWVDRILVSGNVRGRWCSLILTDDQETDHHWPAAALTIGAR